MPPKERGAIFNIPVGMTPMQAMLADAKRTRGLTTPQRTCASHIPARKRDGDKLRAVRAEIMKSPKSFSARSIADAINADPRGVASHLKILLREGFIEIVSRRTYSAPTEWRVVTDGVKA